MFPTYTKVSQRMKQSNWTFRFVYVVRNPIERISSHYLHAAVEHDDTPPLQSGLHSFPLEVSYYYTQLELFRELFGREPILVLMYEDILSDPTGVVRRIWHHFDIRNDVPVQLEIVHSSEKHYQRVLIIKYLEEYGYSNGQLTRKDVLAYFNQLPFKVQSMILQHVKRHYELNVEHRLEIHRHLAKEMKRQCKYDIDVQRWGF
jgi:hypothetical protein